MNDHPMIQLLLSYYEDSLRWKEQRQDLSPAGFNRDYGLTIQGPSEWPYNEAIKALAESAIQQRAASVVIIYSSTSQYDGISKFLEKNDVVTHKVSYLSWQEIYSAMQLVNNDARLIQGVRDRLSNASLVLFMGAPSGVPEVVDQVRAFCDGCLIVFG